MQALRFVLFIGLFLECALVSFWNVLGLFSHAFVRLMQAPEALKYVLFLGLLLERV